MASQAAVPARFSDVGTFASIPSFFPQRTLYESFAADGAFDLRSLAEHSILGMETVRHGNRMTGA